MTFGLVKHNNNSISDITTPGNLAQGKMTLIKEQTASSSSSISFVDGSSSVVLDNTYPIYKFVYINCHPSSDGVGLSFNFSIDSGSNYNVTKTTTFFEAQHSESGTGSQSYQTGLDIAQGTGFQQIAQYIGTDNDQSASGEVFLFDPSSTTFVKHFLTRGNSYFANDKTCDNFSAGYGNTTSAIDAVQFKMTSGNIDSGTIKLYGIKGS
jgi:hypothetical protein